MLFPDMPRRFNQQRPDHERVERVERVQLQAPLQGSTSVSELAADRATGIGPAAGVALDRWSRSEPIDWSQGRWEYITVFTGILLWIVFWTGIHWGWWTAQSILAEFGALF